MKYLSLTFSLKHKTITLDFTLMFYCITDYNKIPLSKIRINNTRIKKIFGKHKGLIYSHGIEPTRDCTFLKFLKLN